MSNQNQLQLFENQPIRTVWNEAEEEWYFSIADVIRILTEQPDLRHAAKYWSVLKTRLKKEGAELTTICSQLKMVATDGKNRNIEAANTRQLLRLIQSIPSKKAEPFKLWLAEVGRDRIEEDIDPELTINRALETYLKKGYDKDWIHQRLLAIRVRNELTEEWRNRGMKEGKEFAILTDEISKAWSGMTTREYKNFKGLHKENLRDNMSDMELILNMLAEGSTRDISKVEKPETLEQNKGVAKKGGDVAGTARQALEAQTGKPVISSKNATQLGTLIPQILQNPPLETP